MSERPTHAEASLAPPPDAIMPRAHAAVDPDELVRKLRPHLESRPEIGFAYLHGSAEAGLPFRDVDVAIQLGASLADNLDSLEYESELAADLTLEIGVPVDVHVLADASIGFQHSVLQGRLIMARDDIALADYRERVVTEYCSFAWLGRAYLRELLLP